jgi:hypothetical protein
LKKPAGFPAAAERGEALNTGTACFSFSQSPSPATAATAEKEENFLEENGFIELQLFSTNKDDDTQYTIHTISERKFCLQLFYIN